MTAELIQYWREFYGKQYDEADHPLPIDREEWIRLSVEARSDLWEHFKASHKHFETRVIGEDIK